MSSAEYEKIYATLTRYYGRDGTKPHPATGLNWFEAVELSDKLRRDVVLRNDETQFQEVNL